MLWQNDNEECRTLPTITGVDSLDSDCFDVTLSNGHVLLLDFSGRIHEPAFAALIKARLFDRPQTDGERLYWPGGPSFTLPEIFDMVMSRERQGTEKSEIE